MGGAVHWHPRPDDHGRRVAIHRPSEASAPDAWLQPQAWAAVLPDGPVPAVLNDVPLAHWEDPPESVDGWEALAFGTSIPEPAFEAPSGLEPAAGVVVIEPDGRIWVVAPTNRFGGHELTFPKGRLDGKSPQAAALAEAYEESGLKVELIGHLLDLQRSQTFTRYYLARRVGGSPADMGWESQCVVLTPPIQVSSTALSIFDQKVLAAVQRHLEQPDGFLRSQ